jgi:hypothetical protein
MSGAMDAERRKYLDLFRRALDSAGEYRGPDDGRGIVTCGSLKFAPYLWILIRSLRAVGCSLPIELWHMEGEVNEPLERWLAPYGVTFRNGGRLPWGRNRYFNGAHGIKPYAVVHSSFREVLFLDADNCAIVDPTFLFDAPEFSEQGEVFWSDPMNTAGRLGCAALRQDFGVTPGGEEFESGQFLVDKARAWRALMLTLHMNELSGYYYRFLFGDKETFRLAFDAVQQPYTLVLPPPHASTRDWRRKGHLQYWTDGRALFQHRACPKWEMIVTRSNNHHLGHLPAETVESIFSELRYRWPLVMPVRERLRPYAGIARRIIQPWWVRPYFGWLRAVVRRVTDRERR